MPKLMTPDKFAEALSEYDTHGHKNDRDTLIIAYTTAYERAAIDPWTDSEEDMPDDWSEPYLVRLPDGSLALMSPHVDNNGVGWHYHGTRDEAVFSIDGTMWREVWL